LDVAFYMRCMNHLPRGAASCLAFYVDPDRLPEVHVTNGTLRANSVAEGPNGVFGLGTEHLLLLHATPVSVMP